MKNKTNTTLYDVAILGAGFAGSILAHKLSDMGLSYAVIDKKAVYPNVFRAEKIEPHQGALLKKLNAFDYLLPKSSPIGSIINYSNDTKTIVDAKDQYGFHYSQTVNNLRDSFPGAVTIEVDKITHIEKHKSYTDIFLTSGKKVSAKLTVLASGGTGQLLDLFGFEREYDNSLQTLNFGFDIKASSDSGFDFNSFNYYLESSECGIDYLTAFKIGDSIMRINIFTQWENKHTDVAEFRNNTVNTMIKYFPNIVQQFGEFSISGKVAAFPTKFYRLKNKYIDNVVVIGDEYQSVSPATGTGLSKILTSVDRLTEVYLPQWVSQDRVGRGDLWSYYHDKHITDMEIKSRDYWCSYRNNASPKYKSLYCRLMNKLQVLRIRYF